MKKTIVAFWVLVFCISFAMAQEQGSPEQNSRKGFFIGFGIGGGGVHAYGDGPDLSNPGFVGNFRIGGGLSDRVLLMYEGFGGYTEESDVEWTIGGSHFAVQFFPIENFYLRPGIGFSVVRAETDFAGFNISAESDVGLSVIGSTGYEFRFGRSFALAPEVGFNYSRIEDANILVYHAILGFVWYI